MRLDVSRDDRLCCGKIVEYLQGCVEPDLAWREDYIGHRDEEGFFYVDDRKDPLSQAARLPHRAFVFETDPGKIEKFNEWMQLQVNRGVLGVEDTAGNITSAQWTDS